MGAASRSRCPAIYQLCQSAAHRPNGLSPSKLLTVAAPALPGIWRFSSRNSQCFASIQDKFDQINIMTYDLSGPYPGWVTWFNSPIYDGGYTFPGTDRLILPSVNGAVNNFIGNGVAPGKLAVGLPFLWIYLDGYGAAAPEGWLQRQYANGHNSNLRIQSSTPITSPTAIIGTRPPMSGLPEHYEYSIRQ